MIMERKVNKFLHPLLILLLALLFLLLGIGSGFLLKESLSMSKYEENVNQIIEIDHSKKQAELNQIVKEGEINIQYSTHAIFNGQTSEYFSVKNIPNNHHPISFTIYDETNEIIYESKQIKPGYQLKMIELTKQLTKGNHECQIKIGYVNEGNVSSMFPIMIEVR